VDGDERLRAALRLLAGREITSLLLEGGPALHAAFWDAGLVDRVQIYRTPHTLGPEGVPWLPASVIDSPCIADRHEIALGADTLLEGYVHRTH